MNCSPLVSIIVPVYQAEKTVDKTVQSVLRQTYTNFELILIDDGSTDASLEKCVRWADKDSRIKVLHHQNHGVSFTRNRGLDECRGNYFIFLDADDEYVTSAISQLVDLAENTNADIVFGGFRYHYMHHSDREVFPSIELQCCERDFFIEKFWPMFQTSTLHAISNKLYRTACIGKVRFEEKYAICEDILFAVDAILCAKIYAFCNSVICIYNINEDISSLSKGYCACYLKNLQTVFSSIKALYAGKVLPQEYYINFFSETVPALQNELYSPDFKINQFYEKLDFVRVTDAFSQEHEINFLELPLDKWMFYKSVKHRLYLITYLGFKFRIFLRRILKIA